MFDLLPDYSSLTPFQILLYIVAGIFGALVRVSWLDKPLVGVYKKDGGWKLGFFGEVIVAVAVAILIDGHPIRAGLAAIFAPSILGAFKVLFDFKEIVRDTLKKVVLPRFEDREE